MNKKYLVTLCLSLLMLAGYLRADDKELFMGTSEASKVKPNVMVLIDSSGSMKNVITYPEKGVPGVSSSGFYPGYYAGNRWNNNGWNSYQYKYTRWEGYWKTGTNSVDSYQYKMHIQTVYNDDRVRFYIQGNYKPNIRSGDWFYSRDGVAKFGSLTYRYKSDSRYYYETTLSEAKDTFKSNTEAYTRHTSNKFVYAKLYGSTMDSYVVYSNYYLRWIFIHASDKEREAVSHFSEYGTFDLSIKPPKITDTSHPDWESWWKSDCATDSNLRIAHRFTRIQVAREVICKLTQMSNDKVYMGLFRFNGGNGGHKLKSLIELKDSTTDNLKSTIYNVPANSSTPLAEALADIWNYYKPGSDYDVSYSSNESSDIRWWCQHNYAIIMTDGQPTSDTFDGGKYSGSIFKSSSYKRLRAYTSWKDWSPSEGWGDLDNKGHFYLDDVAYFLRHQDLYPDIDNGGPFSTDSATGWPNEQNIITYTIGFTIDNEVLKDTAQNGDGEYYTASNYETLVEAFQNVITSILIREFAFSTITAPRRTSTASNDEVNNSFFGYFKPVASAGVWEGHLLSVPIKEKWGFDVDGNGKVEESELLYDTKALCMSVSGTKRCHVNYSYGLTPLWDASTRMPENRNLFTQQSNNTVIGFDGGYKNEIVSQMRHVFDPKAADQTQEDYEDMVFTQIIDKISAQHLGDIFHSDVQYVGAPPKGKLYTNTVEILGATNPKDQFKNFVETGRTKMVYAGTNDGVLHAFYADGTQGGREAWGFIPKEILPSLYNIVIKNTHTYTVDGRIVAEDIYDHANGGWKTSLFFGLRDGGNSYYSMDVTNASPTPKHNWTFSDPLYSGKSWGLPSVGRIKYEKNGGDIGERHVVVLTGGMAFNGRNDADVKGKAVFVVDAMTGELIWMLGYDKTQGAKGFSNGEMATNIFTSSKGTKMLVGHPEFNFPIPSSIGAVDVDNDGYLDTIYFGNTGGNFFKVDISSMDNTSWKPYLFYKHTPQELAKTTVTAIADTILTVGNSSNFQVGYQIEGLTSKAVGFITEINGNKLNVKKHSGNFTRNEEIGTYDYQPVFVEPSIAYDNCDKLWVTFGTGNRDRPRTDPTSGRYLAIIDRGEYINMTSSLTHLKWKTDGSYEFESTKIDTKNTIGWYFDFPDSDNREKLHDPAPVIVPDSKLIPHILFNTYQPPKEASNSGSVENPCAVPDEGSMKIYDIQLVFCGLEEDGVEIKVSSGRISGGGMVGRRYLNMMGGSSVGGVDLNEGDVGKFEPGFPGSIIFWKERKR